MSCGLTNDDGSSLVRFVTLMGSKHHKQAPNVAGSAGPT